jgi:hypothetical protein
MSQPNPADPNQPQPAAQPSPATTTAAATTTTTTDTEKQEQVIEPEQLNPGGYACQTCGITFRTPEELKDHEQKNSDKEADKHVQ